MVSVPSRAQQPADHKKKVETPVHPADDERKSLINMGWALASSKAMIDVLTDGKPGRNVDIIAEEQYEQGDVVIAIGNVHVSDGEVLIIADRITYNNTTSDMLAEGNVYMEEHGQRLMGSTLEFNYKTRRAVIRNSTGFTNSTPDGVTVVVEAPRADKTGEDTYTLDNVMLTACQQKIPRWSFTAKRTRIRLDHQAKVYNAFFRIRNIPVLWLPYASISISKKDRSSGFLTPKYGSSSIKGSTAHLAYFQTLGRSADLLVKTDVYSQRGLGMGFDFRARPDEHSRISFGSFMVKDRLLGPKLQAGCDPATDANKCKLQDDSGSSFYVDAVQYFKKGVVAVTDVNITSSFNFRNTFSDNVLSAISPEERSVFYLSKNWGANSFNTQVGQQSTFVANSIVKTRQLPSVEYSRRNTMISDKFPVYFSFGAALDGVQRIETASDQAELKTTSVVQRLDLSPRLTFPLKSFAGFTLTPSLGVRSTLYSDSIDPVKRQVIGQNLLRDYADLDLDLRAPALAKIFRHGDGTPWFKHVIEPFVEYRRVKGIDDFDRTTLIDERDIIADTNEIEFGFTNRFFVKRNTGEGSTPQTHELLNLTVSQKYFFDPTFGGALDPGRRNQFFPVNTLSGFSFLGAERDVSPLNLKARFYPVQPLFADLRLNYDTRFHNLRDIIVGMGFSKGIFSLSQTWYYTRRIEDDKLRDDNLDYDPTTFPGNQFDFYASVGNRARGPYSSFTFSYDFRDRKFDGKPRDIRSHFINLTTTSGWAWDCCGFEVQHTTFNAGLRNESRFVFAFTLKGIGTFGTQSLSQFMEQQRH